MRNNFSNTNARADKVSENRIIIMTSNGIYLKTKKIINYRIMKYIAKTKFIKKNLNIHYGYGANFTSLFL